MRVVVGRITRMGTLAVGLCGLVGLLPL